jgi:hypothetical protein
MKKILNFDQYEKKFKRCISLENKIERIKENVRENTKNFGEGTSSDIYHFKSFAEGGFTEIGGILLLLLGLAMKSITYGVTGALCLAFKPVILRQWAIYKITKPLCEELYPLKRELGYEGDVRGRPDTEYSKELEESLCYPIPKNLDVKIKKLYSEYTNLK